MQKAVPFILLVLFVAALFWLQHRKQAPASERIIVALDRSESTSNMRSSQFANLDTCRDAAIARSGELDVWYFDSHCNEIYGPEQPSRTDVLDAVKRADLVPDPHDLRIRTRPALLLQSIVRGIGTKAPKRVYVVLLTDGDNDYYGEERQERDQLAVLSRNPGIRFAILGVVPDNRTTWKAMLDETFPDRYVLSDTTHSADDLTSFLNK